MSELLRLRYGPPVGAVLRRSVVRLGMGVTVSARTYLNAFFSSSLNEKEILQNFSFAVIKPNLPLQIRQRHSSRSENGFDLRGQL